MKVSRNQVIEHEAHRFSVDASELGLCPGEWPDKMETDLGNGQPLVLRTNPHACGAGCVYTQQFGCIEVTVWND